VLDDPPDSVGAPAWGTSIRIVNEDGTDAAPSQPGEVAVRGPQVFSGYFNRPHESAAACRDGWFLTGDVGYFDGSGHLFLVDRVKDIIKRSGYTVYPAEAERVLCAHPAVAEAAVIGIPDDRVGEEIKAFVTLEPGAAATEAELIEHCRTQLASYKYPRSIEFRGSLPMGPSGKVLRRALPRGAAGV
jgi:long-chain acyl-CoA synthetase